jgi:glycosyltransferase involved in cell wall biosynthesis
MVTTIKPTFSIVITNYNYGRYVGAAIDSALQQTVPPDEVIVVDDGSTDDSRSVIASYGNRIYPLLQENRGQRGAYNAGFKASRGDLVLFLDSDDLLDPTVVEQVLAHTTPKAAKIAFPLRTVNREGQPLGGTVPSEKLVSGDLRPGLLQNGYYSAPPSSGNVYARWVLEEILPMEEGLKYNADTYTGYLAPFFGDIVAIPEVLGSYRLHGGNHDLASFTNEASVRDALVRDLERIGFLKDMAAKRGLAFNEQCLDADVHHVKLRMSSLRLEPERHVFPKDSRFSLVRLGLKATWSTRYLSLARKLLFSGWFLALGLAPDFLVQEIASIGCSPAARSASWSWLLAWSKG